MAVVGDLHHDPVAVLCEGDPPPGLPAPVREVLGWAVREGATNVVRHSSATGCRVTFTEDGDRVVVEVTDDGHGTALAGQGRDGVGLAGLAERVAAAGGRLQAGSRPGGGFRLRVELPLKVPVG